MLKTQLEYEPNHSCHVLSVAQLEHCQPKTLQNASCKMKSEKNITLIDRQQYLITRGTGRWEEVKEGTGGDKWKEI